MRGDLSKVNFSGLPNLEILDLMSNSFTGEIPESIYSCRKLTTLQLSYNRFHGQVSPSLANLKSLSFLSLAKNAFKNITNALRALGSSKNITTMLMGVNFKGETLPDDVTIIDGFQSLQVLSLGSCLLSGNIPLWLSKLARLEILDLANNRLTGPIPVWIHSLSFLYHLDLSNNRLTEDIPTAVMELPMLQSQNVAVLSAPISVLLPGQETTAGVFPAVLNLGNNHLTGTIPSEIGQLKSLVVLNLRFNSLSGNIPQELCNLTNLRVVDLSHNHLTCSIPSALDNLHLLSTFDVSYNDLEGEIPTLFHTSVVVDGNQKLGDPSLGHDCASTEALSVVSTLSAERTTGKIIFAISFGAFFFVGVLYDQTVLSRYLGVQTLV
jgi:Leucine-rich repeat (LRR) protein